MMMNMFVRCAFFFLIVLRLSNGQQDADLKSSHQNAPTHQRRELFSFWSLLFLLDPRSHCPPGPLGNHCREQEQYSSDSSSSSSSSSSSAAASSSSTTETSNVNNPSINTGLQRGNVSKFSLFWLLAALVAAAVAMAAVMLGSRPQPKPHPLTGSVARRIGLFSTFADSALCCSMERPARAVEMTSSKDDYIMA